MDLLSNVGHADQWVVLTELMSVLMSMSLWIYLVHWKILWYDFVRNEEIANLSHQAPINEAISWRRHSLFGHAM